MATYRRFAVPSALLAVLCTGFIHRADAATRALDPVATPSASSTPAATRSKDKAPPLDRKRIDGGFSYSGTLRAYYFVRQNAQQNAANPNRTAFLPGTSLHAQYAIANSGLRVATTYAAADPFGANGPSPGANTHVDNALPGFSLATFDEAYLGFRNKIVDATIGDRILNYPWLASSDTRIKPASYQGLDVAVTPTRDLTLGITRVIRFEPRTSSAFEANTLLTAYTAGANPPPVIRNTAGALHAFAAYHPERLKLRAEVYRFYDLANLSYADGEYEIAPTSRYAPTFSAQFVHERQTGRAILGRITNDTIGAQVGVDLAKTVIVTFGFDRAPTHDLDVAAANLRIATRGIFLVSGGTGSSVLLRPGVYRVAYGGIASPYGDGYTSNPLYTTSISQSMVERRSPGTSYRLAATYTTPDRRFKAIASEAYYQYDDAISQNRTFEDDVDVQYFFSTVPRVGTYRGLSVRERFANRDQPSIPYDFKYLRTQLEYDF